MISADLLTTPRIPRPEIRRPAPQTVVLSEHAAAFQVEANGTYFLSVSWPGPPQIDQARRTVGCSESIPARPLAFPFFKVKAAVR